MWDLFNTNSKTSRSFFALLQDALKLKKELRETQEKGYDIGKACFMQDLRMNLFEQGGNDASTKWKPNAIIKSCKKVLANFKGVSHGTPSVEN